MLCWKLSILQFTFQIIQTLKRLWSHVHHYTFFTIFRDSLFTSFRSDSNTDGRGRFSLGPLILVSPQSSFSSFWSSASHRSACLCRASLQFHRKFPLKTTTKKQFISTKIKNSMQTVEVKSTSSHNCLSQNDDATLNSWSQVCRWSYIWLISGTGTLHKNMLVSIGYQNFVFWFPDSNNR